jgi:L-seryl-tRNA(Ser) seleniumtransferase
MTQERKKQMDATSESFDSFGNVLDPQTGYARGKILDSSVAEMHRLEHGQRLVSAWIAQHGAQSIANFSGNQREFPLRPDDIPIIAEEWVGPSLIQEDLEREVIGHLGGQPSDGSAIFNRTSAGIVSALGAHAQNGIVLSVVPRSARSHASVIRGAYVARARFIEVQEDDNWEQQITDLHPDLVVVTTITSSLERLDDEVAMAVIRHAKACGAITLLDEAYGARMRPVIHGGVLSLQLGADLTITNIDKAGLSGPRAGAMAGKRELVTKALAWGSQHGLEARAPIAAAALRSLQGYDPENLRLEVREGALLSQELAAILGPSVIATDLGPMITEDDIHRLAHDRAGLAPMELGLVPAETAAALGMILLERHGYLTVNTHGRPGARVSLRLKPTIDALRRAGGTHRVVLAVDMSLNVLAEHLRSRGDVAGLIVGGIH